MQFYADLPEVYAPDDRWLALTHRWIADFIRSELGDPGRLAPLSCLNLGSAGLSYGIPEAALLHVDVHAGRLRSDQNAIVADVQRLPPFARQFAECLCVGSVLNHCDAAAVMESAGRAVRPGGRLILEFETSRSLELLATGQFGRAATVVETFYQDRRVRLWAYSECHVRALAAASGFAVERRSSRHHLSPFAYLISRNSNFAARFACLDLLARRTPLLKGWASHVIFACRKVS